VTAYTDSGEGPAVVLLHGLTCSSAYWLRVAPLLAGLRIVAVDLGGHGLGPHRDDYGYAGYEDDLLTVMDALGLDRAVVAGHSLGGYVALLAASRSDRVSAVLAIDVKSDWTDADAAFAAKAAGGSQRVEPDRDALVARLARTIPPLEPAELEAVAARSIEETDGGWRFRWDRRVLATEAVKPFAFLGRVRCPTVVMAGTASEVMPPPAAERFASAIPGGKLDLVEGAGHHVELDRPDRVAARIRELVRP
jgi:pimeloyl-ACP methyl ester carboxylesterase